MPKEAVELDHWTLPSRVAIWALPQPLLPPGLHREDGARIDGPRA